MKTVIVLGVVGVIAYIGIKAVVDQMTGKKSGCSCGSDGSSCPSAGHCHAKK